MKKFILLLFGTLLSINFSFAQFPEGKVVVKELYSERLENPGGENPTRRATVYLPHGYEENNQRYPVIYFLHGFTWNDSLAIAGDKMDKLLDKAIATNKIKPVILVLHDQYTLYRGSFYTNSSLTGNWADFIGKDLVPFIDKNFRTIANRDSRGIAGHSMGGQGALKMGMLFPDIFSSVYALSPAVLNVGVEEMGIHGNGFRRINEITSHEQLTTGWNEFEANAVVAIGRAYTPNLEAPPYFADFPYEYVNDSVTVNYKVLDTWREKSVIGMVDKYLNSLKKMRAIKFDWGRNEEFEYLPITCMQLSKKLENLGIEHYAEEYIGTHTNKIWTDDGRALNEMLPFFNIYLEFEK